MIIGESGRQMGAFRIGAESAFLSYLNQIDRRRTKWVAAQVRLSLLRPHYRREHHLRAAASCFDALARRLGGETFALGTGDVIFICKGATAVDIEPVLAQLRHLFGDDPMLEEEKEGGTQLCLWYDLETDYDSLIVVAREAIHQAQIRSGDAGAGRSKAAGDPLDAGRLGRIGENLAAADLAGIIRRQPVCRLHGGGPPLASFQEIFVSIRDLRRLVAPNLDLLANRWLFQHLTEVLDRRVLVAVPQLGTSIAKGHFSLNLNVATILSQEFLTFERALPVEARPTVVLELQPIDLLADMELFAFARSVARQRGYRLCLDGLTQHTLGLFDRARLGFDLVKLMWSSRLTDVRDNRLADEIARLVEATGPDNVILCRCDSDDAIAFGRSVGISLFQGYHVDAMIQGQAQGQARRKGTPWPQPVHG